MEVAGFEPETSGLTEWTDNQSEPFNFDLYHQGLIDKI